MRIVVDDNVPRPTVAALESLGHVVMDVRQTSRQGDDDDSLWELALHERALLIATDKEFRFRRNEPHFGILIAVAAAQPRDDPRSYSAGA